jgi:hypothetical protein
VDGNTLLIKNYKAEAAILKHRILTYGTVEGTVKQNTALSFAFAGVSDKLGAPDVGQRLDVIKAGISEVILGGTVAYGDILVSDANGAAVKVADATADVPITHIGTAEEAGTAGAIIKFTMQPLGSRVPALESDIRIADLTLTTAQVLALFTTPITLLAAPGLLKAIVPVSLTAFLDYNSAAYDGVAGGEDIVVSYTNAAGLALFNIECTGFIDQAADTIRYARPSQAIAVDAIPVVNAAVVVHMLTGNIATGNSPLKLRMAYRIINTAW